jgi:60 kDa SS-A/Ro ribonucleoprotein
MRFNKKTVVVKSKTTNLAGGRAFKFDPKTELIHAVLTTFLANKPYESGDARLERIKSLVGEIANEDPIFVAKLAVIARKEFHMRSVAHALIGELATIYKGDDVIKKAIVAIAERPDDLSEIAGYVGLPMPKQVKRGIRNAILKYDRYQLAKYQMKGREFSLVDLFNLTHPKTKHATEDQLNAWRDLMNGKLTTGGSTLEAALSTEDEGERIENFEELILSGKIGYMALLRNLNNVTKYGLSHKAMDIIGLRISDPEQVAKSKQLPFRFLNAYNHITDRGLKDAVSEAMDHAVANVPKFSGRTLIAIDKSGSMDSCLDKAAIFGAVLMKANKNADVMLFANDAVIINPSSRLPVVDLSNEIIKHPHNGGTQVSSVFNAATEKYDRIFIVSDNESWIEANGVMPSVRSYKSRTGADPFIYCIDIQGYGTKDIASTKAFHICGWSERVLDFVKLAEQGGSLVNYVDSYEL